MERWPATSRTAAKHQPHLPRIPGRLRPCVRREPRNAIEVRMCRVRVLSECGFGRCRKYQRGGARLVSLFVVFACSKCVVSGTHRGNPRLGGEPVGIPSVHGGEDANCCRNRNHMTNPFMARAIELSIESVLSGRGGPFGAVIVRGDEIIAEGANQVTSTNDPTAHAEVVAIRQACAKLGIFELKDCELYTSCEPCPMCLGAIYWARLSRIYFANTAEDAAKIGFDDSFLYRELKEPHAERRIPAIQMMRDEALAGFRAWAERLDKIPY